MDFIQRRILAPGALDSVNNRHQLIVLKFLSEKDAASAELHVYGGLMHIPTWIVRGIKKRVAI